MVDQEKGGSGNEPDLELIDNYEYFKMGSS